MLNKLVRLALDEPHLIADFYKEMLLLLQDFMIFQPCKKQKHLFSQRKQELILLEIILRTHTFDKQLIINFLLRH
jgi:hypothetical protein